MWRSIGELAGRRDLFLNLIHAELTARYRTSTLGLLWFVLSPLFMMLILTLVFQHVIRLGIENYPIFVLSALLPWTYFQVGLVSATGAMTRSARLVKRARVPRVLIPLSVVIANLAHFGVSLALLLGLMTVLGRWIGLGALVFLLFVIALETICLTGLSLTTASLNVFFRDVEHVMPAALRVLFYLTPCFYPLSYVPPRWLGLYLLNPMAGIVEIHRQAVLSGPLPPLPVFVMAGATSVGALVIGIAVFSRAQRHFDDYL